MVIKPTETVIMGNRLYLRNLRLSDVSNAYIKWMNDEKVTEFTESKFNQQTKESITAFVRSVTENPDYIFMAIILKDKEKHIGNIKIGPINRNHKFADIGILIGEKQEWGQGYATEALILAVEYCFRKLKLHKLSAGAYAANTGSCRAFTKAGFQIEGRFPAHCLYKGTYVDILCFGIINAESATDSCLSKGEI